MSRLLADVAPLRAYPDFRRVLAGQALSTLGAQATVVGVAYQAYRITGSTLVVGLISLTQLVPLLAGTLWGGAVADAKDRRRLLLVTVAVLAAASAGLAINASLNRPQLWPPFRRPRNERSPRCWFRWSSFRRPWPCSRSSSKRR